MKSIDYFVCFRLNLIKNFIKIDIFYSCAAYVSEISPRKDGVASYTLSKQVTVTTLSVIEPSRHRYVASLSAESLTMIYASDILTQLSGRSAAW